MRVEGLRSVRAMQADSLLKQKQRKRSEFKTPAFPTICSSYWAVILVDEHKQSYRGGGWGNRHHRQNSPDRERIAACSAPSQKAKLRLQLDGAQCVRVGSSDGGLVPTEAGKGGAKHSAAQYHPAKATA